MIDQEQFQQHAENLRREIAAHNDRIRAAGHTPPALPTMTGDIVLDTEALSDHERKLWKEYHLGETDRAEAPTPAAPVSFSRDYNQPFAGDNSAERPLAAQLAGLPEGQRTAIYRAHRSEISAEESTA